MDNPVSLIRKSAACRPSKADLADAVFWPLATWFPLALGLMVQEKPHPSLSAAGLALGLFLIRLRHAFRLFVDAPVVALALRLACGAAIGMLFEG